MAGEAEGGKPLSSQPGRRRKGKTTELQLGPAPPQNNDAEESVLGAMMLTPAAIDTVVGVLKADGSEFYSAKHARIFRAALALHGRGEPVDAITLVDELGKRGELDEVGGKARILELAAIVPASARAGYYARLVQEKALRRQLIRELGPVNAAAWEGDVDDGGVLAALERARALLERERATTGGPIPLAEGLDDIVALVRRYVVLEPTQADAVALWVAHTHAFRAADATIYLAVTSAEKRSGKTRLLDVLELVVARPWRAVTPTEAVVFRKVSADRPTLLLDEVDAIFGPAAREHEGLRALLNAGHPRGTTVPRCVGEGTNLRVEDFEVFCPKGLAGIGELPDTVADRSVRLRLTRCAPGERPERFRRRRAEAEAEPIRGGLARWAEQAVDELADARPEIPTALNDRAADGWEPLLAIADAAGGDWPERVRRAALELSAGSDVDDQSIRVRLLADVRGVFERLGCERLSTVQLIDALAEDEEAPWSDWRHRGTITARALAGLLRPFGIHSRTVRLAEGETPKGFHREQFEEVWRCYLPGTGPKSATTPQPASEQALSLFPIRHTTPLVADTKEAANPQESSDVADVADRSGGRGGAARRAELATHPSAGEAAVLAEVEELIAEWVLVRLDDDPAERGRRRRHGGGSVNAERDLTRLSPALLDDLVELVANRLADKLAPRIAQELAGHNVAPPAVGTSALLTLDELVAELPAGKRPETWKRWLYERLRQGERDAERTVPGAVKLGGSWFFDPEQVRAWLANGA